MFKERHQL